MSLFPATAPQGWTPLTVGDLAQYINGFAFKPDDWGEEGLPIVRIQNLTDPTKPINCTTREVPDKYVVRRGEILVSWSATLDAFMWNGPKAVINQHIFRVVPNCGRVEPRFLFYLLKCVIRDLSEGEHLHGSTMKHINRGPFLAHPVAVPSLAEQRRIVARIEELMERVRRARGAVASARERASVLRDSLSSAAIRGDLSAQWRIENVLPESTIQALRQAIAKDRARLTAEDPHVRGKARNEVPKAFHGDGWFPIPPSWQWVRAEEGCLEMRRGITPQGVAQTPLPGGVPFVKVSNLTDQGTLSWEKGQSFIDLETHQSMARTTARPGDVLMSIVGPPIGQAALIPTGVTEVNINQAIALFRPLPGLRFEYLVNLLLSPDVIHVLMERGKTSSGQVNLNLDDCRQILVPLPPLEEQDEICRKLAQAQTVIRSATVAAEALTRKVNLLEQAILQTAFAGGL